MNVICSLPWTNVLIELDGRVRVCCYNSTVLGDLKEQTLSEIWHGESFSLLRQRVATKDLSCGCAKCPIIGSHTMCLRDE